MKFISDPSIDKNKFAEEILGGTPSMEDIVKKVAELEYLEEIESYKVQRAAEYPDFGAQLDHIYHNGIDSWKTNIVDPVKAKYAKVEIDTDELAAREAAALVVHQSEEYTKAKTRLEQYVLSVGVPESTEEVPTGAQVWDEDKEEWKDGTVTITTPEIPALEAQVEVVQDDENDGNEFNDKTVMVDNPLIVQDRNERVAAQAIVDATPQSVKDSVDGV